MSTAFNVDYLVYIQLFSGSFVPEQIRSACISSKTCKHTNTHAYACHYTIDSKLYIFILHV